MVQLIGEWDCLVVRDDILMRWCLTNGSETFKLILSLEFRLQGLKGLNDDVGHSGRDRTIDLVRTLFY